MTNFVQRASSRKKKDAGKLFVPWESDWFFFSFFLFLFFLLALLTLQLPMFPYIETGQLIC